VSEKEVFEKLTKDHLVWKRDELSRQLANVKTISEYVDLSNKINELNDKIGKPEKESDL
jgi:disulfide oxidoreductase YuzD